MHISRIVLHKKGRILPEENRVLSIIPLNLAYSILLYSSFGVAGNTVPFGSCHQSEQASWLIPCYGMDSVGRKCSNQIPKFVFSLLEQVIAPLTITRRNTPTGD